MLLYYFLAYLTWQKHTDVLDQTYCLDHLHQYLQPLEANTEKAQGRQAKAVRQDDQVVFCQGTLVDGSMAHKHKARSSSQLRSAQEKQKKDAAAGKGIKQSAGELRLQKGRTCTGLSFVKLSWS